MYLQFQPLIPWNPPAATISQEDQRIKEHGDHTSSQTCAVLSVPKGWCE